MLAKTLTLRETEELWAEWHQVNRLTLAAGCKQTEEEVVGTETVRRLEQ